MKKPYFSFPLSGSVGSVFENAINWSQIKIVIAPEFDPSKQQVVRENKWSFGK